MRVLLIVAIALTVTAAIGAPTSLRISLVGPAGTRTLAERPVTCHVGGSTVLNATFGSATDCAALCDQGTGNDGSYAIDVAVSPALTCIGPDGTRTIPGTGAAPRGVPVSFCTDAVCAKRTPYCDCVAPTNLTITRVASYLSRPINVTARFIDNHAARNLTITTPAGSRTVTCSGTSCTARIELPVGSGCDATGAGTCRIHLVARDAWSHERSIDARYSIDRAPPNVTLSWSNETGSWFANDAVLIVHATDEGSGVSAVYVATTPSGSSCPAPGPAYARYDARDDPTVRVPINSSRDGQVHVCAYAEDRAEPVPNRSTPAAARSSARIDTEPPRLSITPDPARWYAANETFTLVCDDGTGSGCAGRALLRTTGSCPNPSSVDPTASPTMQIARCPAGLICHETLCAYGTDEVGHTSIANATTAIDRTQPAITITNRTWSGSNLTIAALVSDTGSGLADCTLSIESSQASGNASCVAFGSDTATVRDSVWCGAGCTVSVVATDRVGNERSFIEHESASGNV